MSRRDFIDAVTEQMVRVWGPEGFHGEPSEYEWLQSACGITEEEDVRWQQICEHLQGVDSDDLDDEERKLLVDDDAVIPMLEDLLNKYRNVPSAFTRQYPFGSLEFTRSSLNEHCYKNGVAFISAHILSNDGARIVMSLDALFRAISAEHPKSVYWTEELFDVDVFIDAELRELGWEPDYEDSSEGNWIGPDQVKTALEQQIGQMQIYIGKAYELAAMFASSGAWYTTNVIRTDWSIEFRSAIRALVELRKNDVQDAIKISESEDAELLQSLVSELVTNDVFRKTRGLNKRLLLATKLLGSRVPKHPQNRLDRIAQNGELCDLNMVTVVKTADEQIWIEDSLRKDK